MLDFKKKVKIALIERDSTMRELAEELGISISYLSDLVNGKRHSIERLNDIKKYLNLKS